MALSNEALEAAAQAAIDWDHTRACVDFWFTKEYPAGFCRSGDFIVDEEMNLEGG